MAYYSGTAADLSSLHASFLASAQTDGWTLTGNVLSKAGVFFRIVLTANNIECRGCENNAFSNPAPSQSSVGKVMSNYGITFPCNYEIFGFAQELFMVINYNVDEYQWMALGKSTIPGLPGQGGWHQATLGYYGAHTLDPRPYVYMVNEGGGSYYNWHFCPALFWGNQAGSVTTADVGHVNHGLDGHGWTWNGNASVYDAIGVRACSGLIGMQPSVWNSDVALLPIRAYKFRPSNKSSLIVDVVNARHCRIDNMTPGDILVIGSDKWKVFPWLKKNVSARNAGFDVTHTGTFGWAIKYEGP